MTTTVVLALLLTSTVAFAGYIVLVLSKCGILPSISDSYYCLSSQLNPLFTFFTWGLALPIMIVAETPLMFFAGAFICIVGASRNFREKFEGTVHVASAIIGVGLGTLSLIFEFRTPLTAAVIILVTAILSIFKVKNKTWWIEITAFAMILLSLYLTQL